MQTSVLTAVYLRGPNWISRQQTWLPLIAGCCLQCKSQHSNTPPWTIPVWLPWGRHIFIMRFPTLIRWYLCIEMVRRHFYTEMAVLSFIYSREYKSWHIGSNHFPTVYHTVHRAAQWRTIPAGYWWLPWHHGPILLTWLTLIAAWISNHMPSKVWDEITYQFPNFNGYTVEVWEWISNFTTHVIITACDYLSMLGLKSIHVSKRGPL